MEDPVLPTLGLQQLARGVERFAVADAIRAVSPLPAGQRRDKIFSIPSTSGDPVSP